MIFEDYEKKYRKNALDNKWKNQKITTLKIFQRKNLQANKYTSKELAKNLRERIKSGQTTFKGLIGYENSVIPDIERAILSGHNM